MTSFSGLLTFCLLLVAQNASAQWTYSGDSDGVSKWSKKEPKCNGYQQSPIALRYGEALYTDRLKAITIKRVEGSPEPLSTQYNVKNDGHGVKVEFPDKMWIATLGGSQENTVAQFHLHWGRNDNNGSEHSLNSKKTAAELHVVTYNRAMYDNVGAAVGSPNGLAVLGTMIVVDDSKPSMMKHFPGFISALSAVNAVDASTKIKGFDLSNYLKDMSVKKYYRYLGSLTTPPCTENVIWTVFNSPGYISSSELKAFQSLLAKGEKEKTMGDNYRPIIELNKAGYVMPRSVYRTWSSARTAKTNVLMILLALTVIKIFVH